jgi:hypothetical protein
MEILRRSCGAASYVCSTLRPVIPDAIVLGHVWPELADSSGSPPSPKAAFGNARLFARTAAYGFRCELTLSANSGLGASPSKAAAHWLRDRVAPNLLDLQFSPRRPNRCWTTADISYSTPSQRSPRCCVPDAMQVDGALVVVGGRESRPHGEGRQFEWLAWRTTSPACLATLKTDCRHNLADRSGTPYCYPASQVCPT